MHEGGRRGEGSANALGDQVREIGLAQGRLKTGTPPRLDGRTIDWARLTEQPSDPRFPAPPNNVMFDTADRIQGMAARIKDRVVVNRTMPFLNEARPEAERMTEEERAIVGKWIDQGAKRP